MLFLQRTRSLRVFLVNLMPLVCWIGGGVNLAICAQAQTPSASGQTDKPGDEIPLTGQNFDPKQPIQAGFVIRVAVAGETEPTGIYSVASDGNVAIRISGTTTMVALKNLPSSRAAEAIAQSLRKYLVAPQVSVEILNVPRTVVFISGAVRRPGAATITPNTTLVELLSQAEWLESADLSQVRIIRHSGEKDNKTLTVHVDEYLKPDPSKLPDNTQNPVLESRDTVFVPYKVLPQNATFTVAGEVGKPEQGIPLRLNPNITVREAISLAGGALPTADRKSVTIRRPSLDTPITIDLDKADLGDPAHNIPLRPDDVVYVHRLDEKTYVTINGGFVKPGRIPYEPHLMLSQMVMQAGGFAPYAREKEVVLLRHVPGDPKKFDTLKFNFKNIVAHKQPDIELLPGDTIWVAQGMPGRSFDPLSLLSPLSLAASVLRGF